MSFHGRKSQRGRAGLDSYHHQEGEEAMVGFNDNVRSKVFSEANSLFDINGAKKVEFISRLISPGDVVRFFDNHGIKEAEVLTIDSPTCFMAIDEQGFRHSVTVYEPSSFDPNNLSRLDKFMREHCICFVAKTNPSSKVSAGYIVGSPAYPRHQLVCVDTNKKVVHRKPARRIFSDLSRRHGSYATW